MTEILLLVAGFLGGCVNTLAGGGSFIVFPALLLVGVPPVLANASNTYAALPGYVSGAIGFWRETAQVKGRLPLYIAISLIGGYAGAELLMRVSDEGFSRIVPWLMLFAVVLFAFGGAINRRLAGAGNGSATLKWLGAAGLLVFLLAISVYGGFFNAGQGVLLLAFLALAGMTNIHAMNALKLWMAAAVGIVAVVRFALAGSIDWYHGTFALVGVTTGAYVAARLAKFIPTPVIRTLIIIYGVGLTAYFFWTTYFVG
jgi:uncharacterized membrane protein YfcA